MKKIILVFCLICSFAKAQVSVWQYHEIDNVKVDSSLIVIQPDWDGLQKSLYNSDLFPFAIQNANPNAFSSLLKCITDGQQGNSTPTIFLYLLGLCKLNFSDSQKVEFNSILTKNYFAIQL